METEKVESEKKKASPRVKVCSYLYTIHYFGSNVIKYNFSSIHKVG